MASKSSFKSLSKNFRIPVIRVTIESNELLFRIKKSKLNSLTFCSNFPNKSLVRSLKYFGNAVSNT